METFARFIRGKSFLPVLVISFVISAFRISSAPEGSDTNIAVVGAIFFGGLFFVQILSGIALDNWWTARIERKQNPFSYWWRVAACGVGFVGFSYLTLIS